MIVLLLFLYSIHSVHVEQDGIPVMRGQWFTDGTWTPVEEDESDLIEKEHLTCFRGQQIQDAFDTDMLTKTVDKQDGERVFCFYMCFVFYLQ